MHDLVVIGGGIIGLAAAWRCIERRPGLKVVVIEKEAAPARHQSGRNSGVIHAGIYYEPGSSKAKNCRLGREMMIDFCRRHGIRHSLCGKMILATTPAELKGLDELERRGAANGLAGMIRLDPKGIREREPAVRGLGALWLPETGVVDFSEVASCLVSLIEEHGGEIVCGSPVEQIIEGKDEVRVRAGEREFRGRFLLACAGLHADRVAGLAGLDPRVRIVPFRGEYYRFKPGRDSVRGLVYPVPDPALPFLGVHFTRNVHGVAEAGPNAVLALSREGYSWRDISLSDMLQVVTWPGFFRMACRFWRAGLFEVFRSLAGVVFARSLARMVPGISVDDLEPGPAGVRAQAVLADGRLAHDFIFARSPRGLHVLNAPSPAATASLAIGDELASRVFMTI